MKGNQLSFMNKPLAKEIMLCSKLRNVFVKNRIDENLGKNHEIFHYFIKRL